VAPQSFLGVQVWSMLPWCDGVAPKSPDPGSWRILPDYIQRPAGRL